jgi:hypothetical protein
MFRIFHTFQNSKMHIGSTAALRTCEMLDDFAVRQRNVGKYVLRICTPGFGILSFGNLGKSHFRSANLTGRECYDR